MSQGTFREEGMVRHDVKVIFISLTCIQLEAVDSEGQIFVVSVWMKRIKSGDGARCVVILEPVEVTKASLLFDGDVSS